MQNNLLKTFTPSLLALGMFLLTPLAGAQIPSKLEQAKLPSLAPMVSKITPAVVNIAVEKITPAKAPDSEGGSPMEGPQAPAPDNVSSAVGSGVIFNAAQGLIVTNAHVVKDARIIIVTLKDGRRYRATLIGKDDGFDIGIVKISATGLQEVNFGDSDQLKVGDFVAAIGSPFGLTETVTSGVVSAINRVEPQIEGFQNFIQTDASINPGNSGGALVNMRGDLVGINTAMVSPTYGNIGIGFAIPSNMAKSVMEQLLKYGKVKRGVLGVVAQNITPELASALGLKYNRGVILTKVVDGSPAFKTGIKEGDIIETVDGKPVLNAEQLHNMLGLKAPGTPIQLTLIRNHQSITISTKVGSPEAILEETAVPFLSGLRLQDFHELQANGKLLSGIIVTNVEDTSAGALAGLQLGDVIVDANSQPIKAVTQLTDLISQKPKQLLLRVSRGDSDLFLVIQPDQNQ
jgi:Do/DeqQ family serine protease